jgi:hypothetical protein
MAGKPNEGLLAVTALDAVNDMPAQVALVAAVVMAARNGHVGTKDAVQVAEHLLQEAYAEVFAHKPN